MEINEARAYYEKRVQQLAEQHRYIAQAQKEAASRMAIIPTQEAEVAWAKGCLDAAEGREVDWSALKEYVKACHALTEASLFEVRGY